MALRTLQPQGTGMDGIEDNKATAAGAPSGEATTALAPVHKDRTTAPVSRAVAVGEEDDDDLADLDDSLPDDGDSQTAPGSTAASSRRSRKTRFVGELFGRHRVTKWLASGGQGDIWLAEHVELGKQIAIKTLREDYERDDGYRTQFLREARLAARIDHPNVVDVREANESASGVAYYAMELVKGATTLREFADTQRAPARPGDGLAERVRLFEEVLQGVAAAHRHGVVHCDIKPSNVLLQGRQRDVKIVDFGTAKSLATASATIQETQSTPMTWAYAAPERVLGGPAADNPTPSVDVYSLGALGYELFTGTWWARTVPIEVLVHRHENPRALEPAWKTQTGHRLGLQKPMSDVLEKALATDPADRYDDAAQLLAAWKDARDYDLDAMPEGLVVANRFWLGEKLGDGGFGDVYAAEDDFESDPERRHVAVKFVDVAGLPCAESDLRWRIDKEWATQINVLRKAPHPNVVTPIARGQFESLEYLVMSRAPGAPFHRAAKGIWSTPGGWHRLLAVFEGIASALDHLHSLPEAPVHRDVKPANIVVDETTNAGTLIDFGIVYVAHSTQTETQRAPLSAGYAAPEVLKGPAERVDGQRPPWLSGQADQWSLAAIVYELLTGFVPGGELAADPKERGNGRARTRASTNVLEGKVLSLAALRPAEDVPHAVADAVMRALEPTPDNRFATVGEFVAALRAASAEIDIRPEGPAVPHVVAADALQAYQGPSAEPVVAPPSVCADDEHGARRSNAAEPATPDLPASTDRVEGPRRGRRGGWLALAVGGLLGLAAVVVNNAQRADLADKAPTGSALAIDPAAAPDSQQVAGSPAVTPQKPATVPSSAPVQASAAAPTVEAAADAPKRIRIETHLKGRARKGVTLRINGTLQTSPFEGEFPAATSTVAVVVEDKRFRTEDHSCSPAEAVCRVEVRRKSRQRPRRQQQGLIIFDNPDERK